MAHIAHATIDGERPSQPHAAMQTARRAHTSFLLPQVEHARDSLCSVAEPCQHKLVIVVLKPHAEKLASTTCQDHHPWHRTRAVRNVSVATSLRCRHPTAETPRPSSWSCQLVPPPHQLQIPLGKQERVRSRAFGSAHAVSTLHLAAVCHAPASGPVA